jgi:Spy/CpxP family protein refolding chaperone
MRTIRHTAVLAFAACAAATALAQPTEGRGPGMPMKPDFAQALSIPPEKAAQVEAVMQKEREEMRKLHQATRSELAKILNAEQLARLDEMMPRRPGGRGGPPERR